MKVGLIGVGTMGSRMATTLVGAGHTVLARDIDPAAERRAVEIGAQVLSSPRTVAEGAEVVLLSLPMPADVASKEAGMPMVLSGATQLLNEMALAKGLGKEDTAAVVKVYEDLLNLEVTA